MRKFKKIILGVITIWPTIYIIGFVAFVISMILFLPRNGPSPLDGKPLIGFVIMALHLLTILVMFGLLVFYVLNTLKSDRLGKEIRILWIVLVILVAPVSWPVYWYLYVWREGKKEKHKNGI